MFLCSSPIFCKEKEDEKFQQIVYVIYKLEEFIYLFDVMMSVYDKVITNQLLCNVIKSVISSCHVFVFE